MDTCSFLIYFEEERLELKFWFEKKRLEKNCETNYILKDYLA